MRRHPTLPARSMHRGPPRSPDRTVGRAWRNCSVWSEAATWLVGACVVLSTGCGAGGAGGGAGPGDDIGPVEAPGTHPRADAQPATVPVIMPDERISCAFEALGTVTVQGPFVFPTAAERSASAGLFTDIRMTLGREAARLGADAALVRRLLYDRSEGSSTSLEIRAVEAVLLRFVDPACPTRAPDPETPDSAPRGSGS